MAAQIGAREAQPGRAGSKTKHQGITEGGFHSSPYVLSALLLACILLAYWQTLKYEFIQDDWFIIDALRRSGALGFLRENVFLTGVTFYRPLGAAYFALGNALFGMNPLGFHCVALLLHFCSSLLVASIAYALASDKLIAWLSAFLYATAVTVHLDALLWMVGIYDVGGAFFFLLAISLFLKGRRGLSAAAYSAALLMKESTIVLPLVLMLIAIVRLKERSGANIRRSAVVLAPHIILMFAYLALRMPDISSSAEAAASGYGVHLFGPHIVENAALYAAWLGESVAPLLATHRTPWIFVLAFAGVAMIMRKKKNLPLLIVLGGWLAAGIAPALLLQGHAFRYYLVYSMPAFALLIGCAIHALAERLNLREGGRLLLAGGIVAVNVAMSAEYVVSLDRAGFDALTIDGSNDLMRKGQLVAMTGKFLARERAELPRGATLLFDWLPTMSFGVRIGPSIWCRDTSIAVYEVKRDSLGRVHLLDPVHPDVEPPVPSFETGYILTFRGIGLSISRLADL